MSTGTPEPARDARDLRVVVFLAACAIGTVIAAFLAPSDLDARFVYANLLLALVGLVAGVVMLLRSRRRGAWEGTLPYAVAMLVLAASRAVDALTHLARGRVNITRSADLAFLLIGAMFLLPARVQFRDHFDRDDRREISADVALIAASLVSVVYLLMRPEGEEQLAALAWSALFATTAAAALAAFIALVLWLPTLRHIGQLMVVSVFAGTSLTVGGLWIRGEQGWGSIWLVLPAGLAALGLAAIMSFEPDPRTRHHIAEGGWGRSLLTAASVVAASVSLATIAAMESRGTASIPEGSILIVLMTAAIGARILANQVRSRQATERVRSALEEKDAALVEADRAMIRLREAIETVAESEERLRLLFDSAVDGIVEVDSAGTIVRANESFCAMVGLRRSEVVGAKWSVAAGSVGGSAEALVALPDTGQATITRGDQDTFLEARISQLPGTVPGRLLLVRDVTAAKVADQTIRSLFKFLQDRDEDRTRLLKRTNAAIEAERNRIARDLHDGPVQGVSAASLSLEAVLLMLKNGSVGDASEMLVKVRGELSEEADNLRRLMSNLRPPILEERGLVPALQETLTRFGKEEGVETQFHSRTLVEVPADLETLAYRLVQEALTNARKHANASEIVLSVDAVAGQLRVEISDDGVGFDPGKARDYLRAGKVGLASMRERIELANGSFLVRSAPAGGTNIVATLPLEFVPASRMP